MTAHRLVLSAEEFGVLVRSTGLAMPPGFAPQPGQSSAPACRSLRAKGVLDDAENVHRSVLANLRVLAAPRLLIHTDVAGLPPAPGLRSVHAIAGPLGASLFACSDGAVELSLFAATELGTELVRAVPVPARERIAESLASPRALRGPLPLAALEAVGALVHSGDRAALTTVADALQLSPSELDRVVLAAERTSGVLRVLVSGVHGAARLVGQVTWLSTSDGWVGVRPSPSSARDRMVTLEPVTRERIGAWVAPFVAEVLA